jgi:hypothetical protein
MVLPAVRSSPCERAVEQAVPERRGVGVLAQDLGGFGGDGVGDPAQTSSRVRPGQGGGVEVALQTLAASAA